MATNQNFKLCNLANVKKLQTFASLIIFWNFAPDHKFKWETKTKSPFKAHVIMKGEFMQKKQKHKTKKRIKFPIAFMAGIAYANNGSRYS